MERFRGSLSSKAARQSLEGKTLLGSRLDWGFKLNASGFMHCNLYESFDHAGTVWGTTRLAK